MDRNNDGVVTFQEFLETCQKVFITSSSHPLKYVKTEAVCLLLFHLLFPLPGWESDAVHAHVWFCDLSLLLGACRGSDTTGPQTGEAGEERWAPDWLVPNSITVFGHEGATVNTSHYLDSARLESRTMLNVFIFSVSAATCLFCCSVKCVRGRNQSFTEKCRFGDFRLRQRSAIAYF